MKFKSETIKEFILENESSDELEYVECSSWVDEGKWSYQDYIFKHDGKFYEVNLQRSGSYYSDYYYSSEDWGDEVECPEVERVEVTNHIWKPVKKS